MWTQTQSPMPAVGAQFRAARETRGLSLSDVAEEIHIRAVHLAEIEAENWRAIGAPVYVRGFLRTYARFLGLDPEEAVAAFNQTLPPPLSGPQDHAVAATEKSPRGLSMLIWVAGGIAIFLIAFVIYNALTLRQPASRPGAALPSNSPVPNTTASALPGALMPRPEPNSLTLRFSAPSWVRVTIDGNVSMEGTFPAGTSKLFHGRAAFVRVGNAGGVQLFVDGKPVGKLGRAGDVVERTFTL